MSHQPVLPDQSLAQQIRQCAAMTAILHVPAEASQEIVELAGSMPEHVVFLAGFSEMRGHGHPGDFGAFVGKTVKFLG